MKQLIHIPQGESHLIGGQWYNQGDHEIDVPDPVEAAPEVQTPSDPAAESAPKPKKSKASVEPAADPVSETPPESSSETKE
ncbi:MAG: hypothetical protein V4498_00270 [candidate division FCPU426 bacterium]